MSLISPMVVKILTELGEVSRFKYVSFRDGFNPPELLINLFNNIFALGATRYYQYSDVLSDNNF